MSASLSIVIPTLDHWDYLSDCLASLREQTFRDFDVLVIDDGSQVDIGKRVSDAYPEVAVHRLPSNRGFAVAANAGLREVKTPRMMLLNNDMTLAPTCLELLMRSMDETGADMAAPLVVWRDRPDVIYSAGDRQRVGGRPESIGFRLPVEAFQFSDTVFGVSAGAAIYSQEIFETVGYLDERFIAYFEDSDLNFRARLAGFTPVCVQEARACHVGSGSLGGRDGWRARQCFRNHALLVVKNFPLRLLFLHGPFILKERIHQGGRVLSSARSEFGLLRACRTLASAIVETWLLMPYALGQRGAVRRLRRISVHELRALLTK